MDGQSIILIKIEKISILILISAGIWHSYRHFFHKLYGHEVERKFEMFTLITQAQKIWLEKDYKIRNMCVKYNVCACVIWLFTLEIYIIQL